VTAPSSGSSPNSTQRHAVELGAYSVSNAGAALPGPLEYLPIEQFERQIDINLTGQLRVTQALLPALHGGVSTWGEARIVLMGSFDARLVGPLFGPYAASKHGLVGLADGLRSELYPAGIKVVLLEPGAVATPIWQRGTGVLAEMQPQLPDEGGPYPSVMEFAQRHVSTLSRRGGSPDKVARAVMEALEASRPRPRRVVGVDAATAAALVQVLPPRLIYRITALPAVWSAAHWRRRLRQSHPR
jgi:NAD(P)-dependent dehydrogenase (short-subunit alcohol dehydrogenase family)